MKVKKVLYMSESEAIARAETLREAIPNFMFTVAEEGHEDRRHQWVEDGYAILGFPETPGYGPVNREGRVSRIFRLCTAEEAAMFLHGYVVGTYQATHPEEAAS